MTRRMQLVAVGVVLSAALLLVDLVLPPPRTLPAPRTVAAAGEPLGGSYVCAAGEAGADAGVSVLAARPVGSKSAPAQVEVSRFHEGETTSDRLPRVFPGGLTAATAAAGDDAELTGRWVAWRDAPAVAWQEWRIDGSEELPDATVAGPCAAPSSPRWFVPGMSTEGGNEARLRLSNPFSSAATVRVGFLTPSGPADPLVLQNLTVPARAVREIVVNETLPEEADLAAVVEVASGRVSVQGVQFAHAAIGGIGGASLLQAAPGAADEWTVPWVSDGARSSSWLWIANPGGQTAAVSLTLHTPDGGELPAGLAEISVPPGELRRVDLTGTFLEGHRTAAVSARSEGAPVVVSAGARLEAPDPARTGMAVQLGSVGAAASWVVSGAADPGRNEQLHLVNPTGEAAVVDIALIAGVVALEPAQWQGIELPPGSTRVLDLREYVDGSAAWSVFVTATSGEVVAGRLGRQQDEGQPLRLVATPGVPATAWSVRPPGVAAVETPWLARNLRTASDPTYRDAAGDGPREPEAE